MTDTPFALVNLCNNNLYLRAVSAVFVVVGARFLALDLGEAGETFMKMPLVRKIILFSYVFVMTGDILVSLVTTIGFIIFTNVLFKDHLIKKDPLE